MWLTCRLPARRAPATAPVTTPARDRGGATLLVTVLFGCGVLIGAIGIVVDVGQLYAERERLQSGADAAALAVAAKCTGGACPITPQTPTQVAQQYANINASDDNKSDVLVCGSGLTGLSPCPPASAQLTACLGAVPSGPYVEVRTTTRTEDDSTMLPPRFAKAMAGNGGYSGTTVGACARVAVNSGPALTAGGVALTFRDCWWNYYTHNGTVFYTSPPAPANEAILWIKAGPNTCPLGANMPGNFGWLDDTGNCTATGTVGNTYGGDPGNNTTGACKTRFEELRASKQPVALPIFDTASGNGSWGTYHIIGFAAFVVTGYKFSGASAASWLSGQNLCSGNERCIYGYFTSASLSSVSATGSGTNYGARMDTRTLVG